MFRKTLKKEFKNSNFLIDTKTEKNLFYIMLKTPFTKIKDDIILAVKKLKFKSFEIVTSSIDRNDQKTLGFVLISKDSKPTFLRIRLICTDFKTREPAKSVFYFSYPFGCDSCHAHAVSRIFFKSECSAVQPSSR